MRYTIIFLVGNLRENGKVLIKKNCRDLFEGNYIENRERGAMP